ncbi:putative membrane protein [Pedobacter sp. UYP24]
MKKALNFYADKDVQLILGTLLRVGVIVSMTVIFAGGALYLFGKYSEVIDYRVFDPHKSGLSSITSVYKGVVHLDPSAITQFGVLLLIFTPVARVVFSVFSFLIERDYLYVVIGLLVLAVILISLSNGLVG